MKGKKLTPKQERFCHVYLETGNASEAYRTAYNTKRMKPESVVRLASRLMENQKIKGRISELQSELKEISDIKKKRILYELNSILEAKITDFIECGYGTFVLKDLSQLPEDMVRAVESIKHTRYGVEIKLQGKSWVTERICKIMGYDAPQKSELSFNLDQMTDEQLDIVITKISSHE